MNVRKVLTGAAAVMLLGGMLTGCGSKPPAPPPPGAPKETEMTPPVINTGTPMQTGGDKAAAEPAAKK